MITSTIKESEKTTPKYPYLGIRKDNGTGVHRPVVLFLYDNTGIMVAKYQPNLKHTSNIFVDRNSLYVERYEETTFDVFEGEVTLKNA